ncbi:hypothetical protein CA54_10930 [Symmachiella macrocystis]|uniref:DUF4238 domain-containing protein n=1 Tax=Symmachiella macrocystis TaxID=2527985 RepID=A0A5C6BJQ8_9PLAN|nr:DUF4238 domain-containing protein [Symmachiella macrocystis]TWU12270.1 hypothetical protein CA54_10930 [Symmachiella macrocystis]
MANSRRHHFAAKFYQKNFAEPIFSKHIRVYEADTRKWNSGPITPHGIGWFPHLYSMINDAGERTDEFENFLQQHVDGPADRAMKVAAEQPDNLTDEQRATIALFIGFAAARSPSMMNSTRDRYFEKAPTEKINDLEQVVRMWCGATNQSYSDTSMRDFMKPSQLRSMIIWAASIQERLLAWKWTFIRASRENPFITSDWPVFAEHHAEEDIHIMSFPISSEVAVIINSSGEIRTDISQDDGVRAMNLQTLERAQHFVICHQDSFPGDESLKHWPIANA